ncbi:hypothetical protein [Mycobacteroides salmoniphilum]|uniref:Uncharacterized protein n=1 Tax=Mycobacteroides salmoniphilum TaxID=404941 RepID=A0A4R8SBX7_9MYCO|nr:hypothetical protein [Mycobacteroides salmoniphilum]TDZ92115.1 hypothetical protein CCUG60885_04229 [Mycobacteroides salmoniphilum]TEA07345.1 hypothetical protein CCUG60883_01378 [Mycobacteroides salmoniphilum]
MSALLLTAYIAGGVAYVSVGLFASRWWWWNRGQYMTGIEWPEMLAFLIIWLWPLALTISGVVHFVAWFYKEKR